MFKQAAFLAARNANGGDFLGNYAISKFPNAKVAFQTMMADMAKFGERCDRIETFIPTKDQPDSPM